MSLTADEIQRAFGALSEELESQNEHAEIVVVGGAALVLLFGARPSTKDVDAYFVKPDASLLRAAAETVAERINLPNDWLNDAAKGYFVGVSVGAVLFDSDALRVHAASLPQLLAMKLSAWRDMIDRSDARLLLSEIAGTADDVWAEVMQFVPPHLLDKASYAFEDLWEALHGPS